jgi:hypothetical protein
MPGQIGSTNFFCVLLIVQQHQFPKTTGKNNQKNNDLDFKILLKIRIVSKNWNQDPVLV